MSVAGQSGGQVAGDWWQTALYRCPCGFAADDADEFGLHLDATDGADPEHFEVLDGWTLPLVQQWQTRRSMRA